jgi:hypothetical protein
MVESSSIAGANRIAMTPVYLAVAFGIVSAVAHAQGTNDTLAQLRGCAMMEQAERLECLARLPRNIAPPLRQARDTDNWVVSETFSPVDYTPIVTATNAYRRGAESSMQLSIRCRGGRTELVVTGSAVQQSAEGYTILYRINDDQPAKLAGTSPSFGTGAAFKADAARLLQSFPERGGIAIRLSTPADVVVDGYFFLGGLKAVREKVSAACRWPQAISAPRN